MHAVPHETQGFPELDHDARGLRKLPVAEAHGFIWAIADPASTEALPDSEKMSTHWSKNQHISVTTLKEDFDLGEEIQSGLLAGANPSHLFGRFEGALSRFNAAVEEAIG